MKEERGWGCVCVLFFQASIFLPFYSSYPFPSLQRRRNSLVGKKRDETKDCRKKDSGRNVLIEKEMVVVGEKS